MSEIAKALGMGVEMPYKGITYRVAPCCYEVQGLFEQHLEDVALRSIMRKAQVVSEFAVREMLGIFQRDCAARVYCFDGTVAQRALTLLPGAKYLTAMRLHKGSVNLDMDEAVNLVEMIYDDPEALPLLEAAVEKADADPNRAKPYRQPKARAAL